MSLAEWVSDTIIDLVGESSSEIVDYVLHLASKCSSAENLASQLVDADMPPGDSTTNFAKELYKRVPRAERSTSDGSKAKPKSRPKPTSERKPKQVSTHRESATTVADLERNSVAGNHIDTEREHSNKDAATNVDAANAVGAESGGRKSTGKAVRKRIAGSNAWDSDEEEDRSAVEERIKRAKNSEHIGENSAGAQDADNEALSKDDTDEQMDKDAKERDEFAERLKQKDQDSTKKLVEDRSTKNDSELQRRRDLANDQEARRQALPEIRDRARQEYLKMREGQRLELLRQQVADEEEMFRGQKLTEREIRDLEYKKEILRLADERKNISDETDVYVMPEDYITEKGKIDLKKKQDALFKRYEEGGPRKGKKGDAPALSEHEQWEQQQIGKSKLDVGSKDKAASTESAGKQYDYVLDLENIDFVLEDTMDADKKEVDPRQLAIEEQQRKSRTIKEVRESLPVYQYRDELLSAIDQFQTLIVVGKTGSGKTTQMTQYLREAGYTKDGKRIGCTQPRRVAAMSVAARVADEVGTKLGHDVGYAIRFEDCTSEKTEIVYMTDGLLFREFMSEPDLASYSVIMIDESHERTLHTDILFALVKDIARFRPDLKLLIASATMNAQKFSEYFDDAPIFEIPGRPYPVDIYYTKAPEANYLQACVATVLQIHVSQPKGDILVFLTGQDEIEQAQESLQHAMKALGSRVAELIICPIYANLPSELQSRIFEPTPEGARKVVLATNIAETSITIDGVVFVIDPGFEKQNSYNPRSGMESLQVVPCSRASANQRAGRAGRVGPGKCFRLYTRHAFLNEMEEDTPPEILRTNLSSVVLMLKCIGINNLLDFDFMDPPSPAALQQSLEHLYALGALNDRGDLTKLGRRMAEFPMDPMMAKALLASEKYHCSEELASICAMLSVSAAVYYRPREKKEQADRAHASFVRPGGDHIVLLTIWEQWVETGYSKQWCHENYVQYRSMCRARDLRDQIVGLMERVEIIPESNPDPGNTEPIRKALTSGFFYNSARLQKSGDSYATIKRRQTVHIHPSSVLRETKPKIVVYYELMLTSREFMRQVIEIDPKWLLEVAPHYYKKSDIDDDIKRKMPKPINAKK
ncbi:hypothetical protein GGF40_000367 [Coemansia sp. RSA 1286]|nr:hypothetical protein IWW45_004796 [Coemansia sp. RSA 485]KAJ2602959.1 hypothetical protein GGF39_000462 [Coemansia sp. RSA 1721]KAJ2640005.1 hypothetical protein GGF40_000367 [Coemansia sp. RSA 1286]